MDSSSHLRAGIFNSDLLSDIANSDQETAEMEFLVFNAGGIAAGTGDNITISITPAGYSEPISTLEIDGQLARFQTVISELSNRNGRLPDDVEELVKELQEAEFNSTEFTELRDKASSLATFYLHQSKDIDSIKH